MTLVWTDPAASTGSTSALIHDLDLVVIAQSTGTMYYPNGGTEADTVNNVEKITITDTTELETYTIQVRAVWNEAFVASSHLLPRSICCPPHPPFCQFPFRFFPKIGKAPPSFPFFFFLSF